MQFSEISKYAHMQEHLSPKFTPDLKVFEYSSDVDVFAANTLIDQIHSKPDTILTLPTGNTPIGVYEQLVTAYKEDNLNLNAVTIFNLDEYYPISQDHPSSYTTFMRRHLIDHMPIGAWYIPNGESADPYLESERYRQLLEQNQPIDIAILCIGPGTTCHIGFNEKGTPIDSGVSYVPLHPETREANAKLFDDPENIPNGTITQGIADILQAKKIILLAKGVSKAWGVNRALNGPVSAEIPVSFLRLHPNVTFVLDKDAGLYLK